jgi:hypothetical protein
MRIPGACEKCVKVVERREIVDKFEDVRFIRRS